MFPNEPPFSAGQALDGRVFPAKPFASRTSSSTEAVLAGFADSSLTVHSDFMNKVERPKPMAGYDKDFALWSSEQAALLRAGRTDGIDWENVAEEIESLGRGDRHQIENRLGVLLVHLLKYRFQPEQRSNSWRASILEQRSRINRLLRSSPSLTAYPAEVLAEEYVLARLKASGETGLPEESFPQECEWTVVQILDPSFLP